MNLMTILWVLIMGGLLTYVLSMMNKKLGAVMTILTSFASLLLLIPLKSLIGTTETVYFFQFQLTEIGWYFAMVLSLTYAMSACYNVYFTDKTLFPNAYHMLFVLSLGGSFGLFFAKDFITFFVFWELVVWTSALIIPMGKSRRAAVVYYVISTIGSLATLYAILLIHQLTGSFIIRDVFVNWSQPFATSLLVFSMLIMSGLTKIGIFPFHVWLPLAHGSAPHTFSPILSGGLVKLGAFVAYISIVLFPAYDAFSEALSVFGIPLPIYLVMVLGAISIVLGTLMAIKQDDAKKLLAYSSVANGGYILIGLLLKDQIAFAGGLLHLFAHAVASATAFLTIAAVAYRTGTTKMSELGGMIHRMPITYTVYLIAIISMAGIPPMVGFASKWLILQALADKGLLFIALAAFFGSIGSFLYVFRPLSAVFLGQLAPRYEKIKEAPLLMVVPMVLLTLITLGIGIFPHYVLAFITDIQVEAGIPSLVLDGRVITTINGTLDAFRVFVVFGYGFVIALVLYLVLPGSRRVGLMDTYTSAEFIYTPELLHYSHGFYAYFERLYSKHPSTLKVYEQLSLKLREFGMLVDYAWMSIKPQTTVFWIMLVMTVVTLGGVLS